MTKLRALVGKHQLVSFYVLTYAITWGLWIPFARLYFQENLPLPGLLMVWGLFGPALAGILLTRVTSPERHDTSRKVSLAAFFLGLALSALVFALNNLLQAGTVVSAEVVIGQLVGGLLVGIPPALVISSTFSRNSALRGYLRSLIKPSGSLVYYLVALLLPPFTDWVGTLFPGSLGRSAYYVPPPLVGLDAVLVLSIVFAYQFFYGNTLGEEVGWRGFALPRLQARHSPLVASLIIALLWFPWHLPLKVANPDVIPYLYYALSFVPTSILLTWLYNRTGGSIMAVGLAHASGNVSGKLLFGVSDSGLVVGFIVAAILALLDRMWDGKSVEHPVVTHSIPAEELPYG